MAFGNTFRNIVLLIFFILSGLFVWYFFRIILYVLISMVLSLLGQPLVELLQKIHVGKIKLPLGLCAFITLLLMISIISGLVYVFFPLLVSQAEFVSDLDVAGITRGLEEPLMRLESGMREIGMLSPNETIGGRIISEFVAIATFDRFSLLFNSFLSFTAEIFFGFLAISFITFFFLKEKNLFSNIIVFFTPNPHKEEAREIFTESKSLLRRYLTGLITDLTAVFILISFCMWLLGLPNALVIGFFAGLLNIIPYIGPIIATFIGMFLGISVNLDMDFYTQMLPLMLKIAGCFIIVNTIDVGVLQPMIYSKSVRAHPLEIFIVFLMAGMLAGVFGMIIAIPTYSVIRIIVRQFLSKSRLVAGLRAEFNKAG
jgi:predicted PurR-regulated permease PerM